MAQRSKETTIFPVFLPYSGCPSVCSFCNQHITGKPTLEQGSLSIKDTISHFLSTLSARKRKQNIEVAFYGGSFTGLPKEKRDELLSQVYPFLEKGLISGIRISTRPDFISRCILNELMQSGITTIELGVPSTNQSILDIANRGHSVDDIYQARDIIGRYRISVGFQLMYGLPGDTRLTMADTLEDVCRIKPDFVRIHPAIVLKNTMLEKLYKEAKYTPLSLGRAIVIAQKWLTRFEEENIPVIRMGLQPVDIMSEKDIICAGPFHPSFGELVLELKARKQLLACLNQDFDTIEEIKIYVPSRKLSQYKGHGGRTISWLKMRKPNLPPFKLIQNPYCHDQPQLFV